MSSQLKKVMLLVLGALLTVGCVSKEVWPRQVSGVFEIDKDRITAPFGDRVSENIINYSRVSPNIGLAGKLTEAGVREAHKHGFVLVIDLRQPNEDGVEMEQRITGELKLPYVNIPLSADKSILTEVDEIAALIRDEKNYPVLIHCGSANRAGAFWTLYRASLGVDPIVAIEEGRAAGLSSREKLVREILDLPVEVVAN